MQNQLTPCYPKFSHVSLFLLFLVVFISLNISVWQSTYHCICQSINLYSIAADCMPVSVLIRNGFDLFMLAQSVKHNLDFHSSEDTAKKMSRLWNQVEFHLHSYLICFKCKSISQYKFKSSWKDTTKTKLITIPRCLLVKGWSTAKRVLNWTQAKAIQVKLLPKLRKVLHRALYRQKCLQIWRQNPAQI